MDASLRNELFESMRQQPWLYDDACMRLLMGRDADEQTMKELEEDKPLAFRFILEGGIISYDELVSKGVVPQSLGATCITNPNVTSLQDSIRAFGPFPLAGSTEVCLVGAPSTGKTTILSALLGTLARKGAWERIVPMYGTDRAGAFCDSLIDASLLGKHVESTYDDVAFAHMLMEGSEGISRLTLVDISGGAYAQAAFSDHHGKRAWEGNDARRVFSSRNRKALFFVVDCSSEAGVPFMASVKEQQHILNGMLDVLSSDGRHGTKDSTMSRVAALGVIVSKSDLMQAEIFSERARETRLHLSEHYSDFMERVVKLCRQYGINADNGNQPYVFDFSSGTHTVGNSYVYTPQDAQRLIDFLSQQTPHLGWAQKYLI